MVCLKLLKKNILPAKVIEFLFYVLASIALLILNQSPDINEKYILGKRLGKGSFGKVFLSKTPEEVLFAKENPFVAIKVSNFTLSSQLEVITHRKLNNRYRV